MKGSVLFASLLLCILFLSGETRADRVMPLMINDIVFDSKSPDTIYVATRPQGVMKSLDGGITWHPARKGIANPSAYHLVINPADPKILYVGTFGGGIYKTVNGGIDWFGVNNGLGNTNIHQLIMNPSRPDQLIGATSTGDLFITENGGDEWTPFSHGLPFIDGEVFASLQIMPGKKDSFLLARRGFYKWNDISQEWQAVPHNLDEQRVVSMAYDVTRQILYVGTLENGLYKAEIKNNLMALESLEFKSGGKALEKHMIHKIVVDPTQPNTLYVATINSGLFKTTDYGEHWNEINDGLPTKDIQSLVLSPLNNDRLIVGTHGHGQYISGDGGKTWLPPATVNTEPLMDIIASLGQQHSQRSLQDAAIKPPASFSKCSGCHGWTDPFLSKKATYFRVPANRRDWEPTVKRMSQGAHLSLQEEQEIIRFLTRYSNRSTLQ